MPTWVLTQVRECPGDCHQQLAMLYFIEFSALGKSDACQTFTSTWDFDTHQVGYRAIVGVLALQQQSNTAAASQASRSCWLGKAGEAVLGPCDRFAIQRKLIYQCETAPATTPGHRLGANACPYTALLLELDMHHFCRCADVDAKSDCAVVS